MAVTVSVNGLTCAHQTSTGIATATLPDVCRTPPNSVPVPYPNIALASDLVGGTTTLSVDGSPAVLQSSMFVRSTGDEAGTLGGVVSQVFAMEATFLSFSPTVLMEGEPVCRLTDKLLMNKGNTVCMAGLVVPAVAPPSPVPFASMEPPPPTEPMFCIVDRLDIGCSHEDRKPIDLTSTSLTLVEVISTRDNPDKIVATLAGACEHGHDYCPALLIAKEGHGEWHRFGLGRTEFELPPPVQLPVSLQQLKEFIERFCGLREAFCDTYLVCPMVCAGGDEATTPISEWVKFDVYHELELEGALELEYSHPKIKTPGKGEQVSLGYDRLSTFSLKGAFKGKLGGQTFELEADIGKMKDGDPLPIVGGLIDRIGKLSYTFDSMRQLGQKLGTKVDFTPCWPKWKITAGAMKLVELPGSMRIGPEGKFSMAFDPLFGLKMTVSILDWIIIYAGSLVPGPGNALARALLYIKDLAKSTTLEPGTSARQKQASAAGASVDVDIELTASGDVFGGLAVKYVGGELALDEKDTKIGGKVGIKLEARLIANAKIWRVEASGGGKVGAAAAEGAGSKPCELEGRVRATIVKGQFKPVGEIEFTGLALYYVLFVALGASGAENEGASAGDEPDVLARPGAKPAEEDDGGGPKLSKTEMQGTCVLLKPWTEVFLGGPAQSR